MTAGPPTRLISLLLLFAVGMGWGMNVNFARYGMTHGLNPLSYIFWAALGSGLIALGIALARRDGPKLDAAHWRYYAAIGAVHVAAYNTLWFTVVQHIPAGVMAILFALTPTFTYGLSITLGMDRFAGLRMAGIVSGLLGVVVFIAPDQSLPDPSMAIWVVLGLAAPTINATSNILMARLRPPGSSSLSLTPGLLLVGTVMILPIAVATGEFQPLAPPFSWAELALLGHTLVTPLAFIGMVELIRRAGPTFASQNIYVTTLSGVLLGIAILGEAPSPWVWVAAALILCGVVLVNLRTAPRAGAAE